jgi:hypothetical protein
MSLHLSGATRSHVDQDVVWHRDTSWEETGPVTQSLRLQMSLRLSGATRSHVDQGVVWENGPLASPYPP